MSKASRGTDAVERADADFVGDVHARGAAADGIDARQVRGGAPQRIVDAVEVVLRVGLRARAPRHLVAEDDFAVDHGGALAVAGAEVEADAAALQMAAQRRGGFALLGRVVVGDVRRSPSGGRRRGRP